ncbi:MAG: hypothetical protein ACK52I_00275 [Pseudomonadota bacterium]
MADRLNAAVRDEVERLKTLTLSQMTSLPPSAERKLTVDDEVIVLTTWHDLLPSGEHRIVAQAGQKTIFGLGVYLSADGFAVSGTGTVRTLSDDELTSFR